MHLKAKERYQEANRPFHNPAAYGENLRLSTMLKQFLIFLISLIKGPDAYKNLSLTTEEGGTKLYGVSGKVKNPGLWELPLGTTIGEIFHNYAGGMKDGYKFRGLLPGGASTDFLTDRTF